MSESSDEGELLDDSPLDNISSRGVKRARESSDDSDGQVLDRPSAPVHPSQQQQGSSVTSPYDTGSVASPSAVADTPDPDYQDRVVSSNDRVFTGCSSIDMYTLDLKVLCKYGLLLLDWRGNLRSCVKGAAYQDGPGCRVEKDINA